MKSLTPRAQHERVARGLRTIASAVVLAVLTLALTRVSAHASTQRELNPCSFVTNDDVFHVLGWTVEGRERKPFDLHGGTGAMCFISSSQGEVIVILPDLGSDYPGISVYNDPNAAELEKKVYGLGAEVTLYNGTVYVARGHRNVAVKVVPQNHAASYDEVEGFAKVVIRHLH